MPEQNERTMKATIDLYEVMTPGLRIKNKRGTVSRHVWIARIGPVSKICPSERSACNFLEKHGFRLNDKMEWELTKKPEADLFIEMHYKKVF